MKRIKKGTIILITDIDKKIPVFEGTLDQFKDCFFSNANRRTIRMWCDDMRFDFEFIEK